MVTVIVARLKDEKNNSSWKIKAARTVSGFRYNIYNAGFARPIAHGYIAVDMDISTVNNVLKKTIELFGCIPVDPEKDGCFGNTSPQLNTVSEKVNHVGADILLPLEETSTTLQNNFMKTVKNE